MLVIIKEILIWMTSFLIAWVLWYPVNSQIDFRYQYFTWAQTILLIQYIRWYIYYDKVIFFKNNWIKLFVFFINIYLAFTNFFYGMDIIRLLDNFDISDMTTHNAHELSQTEFYHLYRYIKKTLIFLTYCTSSVIIMLDLKMLYKTIGFGNQKVKKYLEPNS